MRQDTRVQDTRVQDLRFNEKGFFNLDGYLSLCDKDWRKHDISAIINAPRNIGKSYNTWEFIVKEIWEKSNHTQRIVYLRTNLTKLRTAREDFNSKYRGRYYMSETKIYKIFLDDDGKELKEQRVEVGSVCGVANAENYKSARFENYVAIFWDEYNELTNVVGIWNKWIDLFKTIKRFNTPFLCLLVGNKVNANNDILVHLEIELPKVDTGDDIHIYRKGNIHFIDISIETFNHLKQEEDMVNVWASYDDVTNAFLNEGGYIIDVASDVLVYRTRILPTKRIKYYLSYGEYKFEYGIFNNDCVYFHLVREPEPNYKVFALDVLGSMRSKEAKVFLDEDSYNDFAEYLSSKAKNKKLYYSSFDAKTILEPYIIRLTSLVK